MTADEALEQGIPLTIEIDPESNHYRLVVGLVEIPGGWVFADVGWPESTGHPLHFIRGKLRGKGPWRIGKHRLFETVPGSPLWEEWEGWKRYLETPEGRLNASRENLIRQVHNTFR